MVFIQKYVPGASGVSHYDRFSAVYLGCCSEFTLVDVNNISGGNGLNAP